MLYIFCLVFIPYRYFALSDQSSLQEPFLFLFFYYYYLFTAAYYIPVPVPYTAAQVITFSFFNGSASPMRIRIQDVSHIADHLCGSATLSTHYRHVDKKKLLVLFTVGYCVRCYWFRVQVEGEAEA